ncbi:MAG: hypothetical protein KBS81_07595, partial [Spirochaetales bacterium]|nr:hypothetical protein [Candidatus Physcosoma equi]
KPVISAGIAYEKKGILNTKMAADLVDINGFIDEYQDESLLMRTAMKHLNAGVEVNFGNALAARAGISQGYMSLGTSFNLMLLRVDAAYYWKEMGAVAGVRGLDCFTIRFNLGFER